VAEGHLHIFSVMSINLLPLSPALAIYMASLQCRRTALHSVAMLVSTAATPTKNDPSKMTIVDSFPVLHVLHLF